MFQQEMVMAIIPVIAAGFAFMLCWPHLLLLLGLRRYRNGTYGGPKDLSPDGKPDIYRDKYQQLLARGFKPLGIHWSRVGHTVSTETYVFGCPEHRCLAQIYSRSHNLYLVSAFEGGDVMYTMDTCPKNHRLPGYWVTGVLGAPVVDLLTEHRRKVDEWAAQGREPLPTACLADAPPIFRAVNTHPANGRLWTSAAATNLGFSVFILALGAGLAGWRTGFSGAGPWLGMIAAGAFLKWLSTDCSTRVKLDPRMTETTEAPASSAKERVTG
jgi:hypothetical protein